MCEAVDFFRQALAEQGLDADVTVVSDNYEDTFYVSKDIAGENITLSTTVTLREQYDGEQSVEKLMAIKARDIAQQFEEKLTEIFSWDGRRVEVQPYSEAEASCSYCGATAGLPPRSTIFAEDAELSSPQPQPVEEQTVLDSLDEHSRVVLKMYLMGKLREKCEPHCPNAVDNSEAPYGV